MTIYDKTRDEKMQYDINRKAAEILTISSEKTDNYEYFTSEEITISGLWSEECFLVKKVTEQGKFTYFH